VETNNLPNFNIYWVGWKTDLYTLHKAGWTVNIEENHCDRTFSIAINNTLLKVVGLCSRIDDSFFKGYKRYPDMARGLRFEARDHFPTLQMQYLSFKIAINIVAQNTYSRFSRASAVDIMPGHTINLEDVLPNNEYVKAPESEIIVPEYTIPELMDLIKERQAPRQKEIRERLRKETNPKIITENINIVSVSGELLNEENYSRN